MPIQLSSISPQGQEVTVKPKADVRIGWQWEALYAEIRKQVSNESDDAQTTLDPKELQLELLQDITATLLKYTTAVSGVKLISCDVSVPRFPHDIGAHLRELNSKTDELLLQVCLHPYVVIQLRMALAPDHSLIRSKQELLDAMADVKPLFPEDVKPEDSHVRQERERMEKRIEAITTALKNAPRATPEDIVLIVIDGIVKTLKNSRSVISRNAVKEMFRLLKLKKFPTKDVVDDTLARMTLAGHVQQAMSSDNHGTVRLLQPGQERLTTLLK